MEPRACVAAPEGISGGIVVYATHQAPHALRADLAGVLGMDANLIRVVNPDMGGGFGIKFGCYPEDVVLAALARKLKRPLKWVETRVEHMLATTHGRDQVADIEVAVEDDGTVDALRMKVTANIGAYPGVHVHPGPHAVHGRGHLQVHDGRSVVHVRVHQHDHGGRVPRRRPAGGRVLPRADDGHHRRRAEAHAGRGAPQELHPAERVPVRDADGPELRLGRVRQGADARDGAGERAEAARGAGRAPGERLRQAARHRPGVLRRDVRLRPVRERGGARGLVGDGDRANRHLRARPGPRDDVRADRGGPPRRRLRRHRGEARRHGGDPDGQRHRRLAQRGGGRHVDLQRDAEGAGEGAADRGVDAGGVVRATWSSRTASTRSRARRRRRCA